MSRLLKEISILKMSDEMFIDISDDNIKKISVLFFGPPDSAFYHGVFAFDITIPDDYPFSPPKVIFLTGGVVGGRMHPNLYQDGKVCLSILNTWGKNEWSPLLTIEKLIITIKALLDNNPLAHEPSFQNQQSKNYAVYSSYYSLKSILDMYLFFKENRQDSPFGDIVKDYFLKHREEIIHILSSLSQDHNGQVYKTIHHNSKLFFDDLKSNLLL